MTNFESKDLSQPKPLTAGSLLSICWHQSDACRRDAFFSILCVKDLMFLPRLRC
jgi:hypothetical protein